MTPNILEAEEMTLRLELRYRGISYTLYDAEEQPYGTAQDVDYPEGMSTHEGLTHLLYELPVLSLPYREVRVYYMPSAVTLVPESLYDSAEGELWRTTTCPSEEPLRLLPYTLPEESKVLLGAYPEALVLLLQRQYLSLQFVPVYMPRLHAALEASRTEGRGRLMVLEGATSLTIAHVAPRGLLFLNTYDFVRPEDESSRADERAYYRSLVWQTLGLSAEHCHVEEVFL